MNEITIYDHRGEPAELARPSWIIREWWVLPMGLVITLMVAGVGIYHTGKRAGAASITLAGLDTTTITAWAPSPIPHADKPARVITEKKFTEALEYAVEEWRRACPKRAIVPPVLLEASCSFEAIACVDRERDGVRANEIKIPTDSKDGPYDWPSILMHEMGHLLGVPHIDDDPLMERVYAGPVKHPSKFAIAIARTLLP